MNQPLPPVDLPSPIADLLRFDGGPDGDDASGDRDGPDDAGAGADDDFDADFDGPVSSSSLPSWIVSLSSAALAILGFRTTGDFVTSTTIGGAHGGEEVLVNGDSTDEGRSLLLPPPAFIISRGDEEQKAFIGGGW